MIALLPLMANKGHLNTIARMAALVALLPVKGVEYLEVRAMTPESSKPLVVYP